MGTEEDAKNGAPWKKRLRIGLLALFAVYFTGWIVANLTLNSTGMKRKIGERVALVVGAPMEIGAIRVSPFGTVRLKDLRIEVSPEAVDEEGQGEDEGDAAASTPLPLPLPLFASAELRVKVSLLSLLTKSIRIKSVLVEEPVVSLMRTEDGGFLLPEGMRAAADAEKGPGALAGGIDGKGAGGKESAGSGMPGAGAPPQQGKSPPDLPGGIVPPKGGALVLPPEFARGLDGDVPGTEGDRDSGEAAATAANGEAASVSTAQPAETPAPDGPQPLIIGLGSRRFFFGDLIMRRGTVQVLSVGADHSLLRVEDMEMRFPVGSERRDEGAFTAKKAVLFETVEAESLEAKVALEGLVLNFTDFEADLAGGKVTGGFRTSPFFAGLPFLAELKVEDVSVPDLSERAGAGLGVDGGTLGGGFRAIGQLRLPETYQAIGAFGVDGAHVTKFGFLSPLSGAIDFKGLEDVAFDEMAFEFTVQGGNVRIDDMRVSSPEIVMSARGFVNFQGLVSLATRLYIGEKPYHAVRMIEDRLPEGMSLGYQPFGNGERFYRDYLIQGAARNPMINFWAPTSGVPIGQLREQIGQLLSAGKAANE